MPQGYTGSVSAAQLLNYFTMSDVHIADKESPAELFILGWGAPYLGGGMLLQSYSPIAMSTTQVLDAAVKTINGIHRTTPLDFGMFLGDATNCCQYNELRWFIDVMDGQYITPSSGDHVGADSIDYQMPFQAAGLDPSLPWYASIGNHDQFWMGGAFPSQKIRDAQVGSTVLNIDPNINSPGATERTGICVGVIDGSTQFGTVIKGGLAANFATPPTVVADPNRFSVSTDVTSPTRYVSEFYRRDTGSTLRTRVSSRRVTPLNRELTCQSR